MLTILQQFAAAQKLGRAVQIRNGAISYLDGKPAPSDAQLAAAVPVPQTVEMWRVRAVLTSQGKAADVDAAIAAMPQPAQTIVSTAWNYGNVIERNSPTIASLAAVLKMSAAQVDALFIAANAIAV